MKKNKIKQNKNSWYSDFRWKKTWGAERRPTNTAAILRAANKNVKRKSAQTTENFHASQTGSQSFNPKGVQLEHNLNSIISLKK